MTPSKGRSGGRVARGWGIAGNCGLYVGWEMTRWAAIEAHCAAYEDPKSTWEYCKAKGDYPVKLEIRWTPKKENLSLSQRKERRKVK